MTLEPSSSGLCTSLTPVRYSLTLWIAVERFSTKILPLRSPEALGQSAELRNRRERPLRCAERKEAMQDNAANDRRGRAGQPLEGCGCLPHSSEPSKNADRVLGIGAERRLSLPGETQSAARLISSRAARTETGSTDGSPSFGH